MKESYTFEEFHCADNSSYPVHISSPYTKKPRSFASLYKKKSTELSCVKSCYNSFVDSRSSPNYLSSTFLTPTPTSKLHRVSSNVVLGLEPQDVLREDSFAEDFVSLFNTDCNSTSVSIKDADLFRTTSVHDLEVLASEEELKKRLADSLSPSPFRNEDPNEREAKLEQLVASTSCPTKSILFSQFYKKELMGEGGHRAWKIALKEHIVHTFESISLIKKLNPVPGHIIEKKRLPAEIWSGKKKLLVFDLDETLVHCVTDNIEKADKIITVILATGEKIKAGVNIRPYAVECLKELAEHFELVVFTASHENYANVVIDILDPNHTLFSKRLFRNSCIKTDIDLFIKDLRILNHDLKSVIIVDNSIFSFAFQLDNGIPIIPFYDDKEDHILPKIKDYLMTLKDLDDFRIINMKNFSLTRLYQLDISSFLKYYYDEPDLSETHEAKKDEPELFRESEIPFTMCKKAQAVVEDQLVKLKNSLPKYLASQRSKSNVGDIQ